MQAFKEQPGFLKLGLSDGTVLSFEGVVEHGYETEAGGVFYLIKHNLGEHREQADRILYASYFTSTPRLPRTGPKTNTGF